MMQSEVRKKANDTQKTQWGEEHRVVGSGASHAETLGLVYSANPEYLWWLSQNGTIHCNGTEAVTNSNLLKKSSMHGQFYREGMRALQTCSNGKGSKLCRVQLFRGKKNPTKNHYFINQLPPETIVLLSPQSATAFCSSEILFLMCCCSWRDQGLDLNKKDLKQPLKSCWYSICHTGI